MVNCSVGRVWSLGKGKPRDALCREKLAGLPKKRIDEYTKSMTHVFVGQREHSREFTLELLLGSKLSLTTESVLWRNGLISP
jgi:hypothetical protein